MSARGTARRGANDDHTEELIYYLDLALENGGRLSGRYDVAWFIRAAKRARRLYPDISRAITEAEDPFSLPLSTYRRRIESARNVARIIPAADADLEHVGHVCGETRDDDLRQLRGAFGLFGASARGRSLCYPSPA